MLKKSIILQTAEGDKPWNFPFGNQIAGFVLGLGQRGRIKEWAAARTNLLENWKRPKMILIMQDKMAC